VQVGSEEPLDGSLNRVLDAHFDGRDRTARLLRPKPLLCVHHPRYAKCRPGKRQRSLRVDARPPARISSARAIESAPKQADVASPWTSGDPAGADILGGMLAGERESVVRMSAAIVGQREQQVER
jgi:hypothetical protein